MGRGFDGEGDGEGGVIPLGRGGVMGRGGGEGRGGVMGRGGEG